VIETMDDLATKLLRTRSKEAQQDFRPSVRPMYRNSGDRLRPEHVGSCILLNVDDMPILATAAHILDNLRAGWTLYVGGQGDPTSPVRIRAGNIAATPAPNGNRNLDHFDCGFWRLPDEAVRELGDVKFVDASRLADNREDITRHYYMVMGYRLKRNRSAIDHKAKIISNRLSRYSGSVSAMPRLADELGVVGEAHMFMELPKFGQDEDNRRINSFGPVGFSGGPLLDLGDFTLMEALAPGYVHRASLSGMMVAYYPKFRAMAAVKIGFIASSIRQLLRPTSP
jgi:hypothetical protein